MKTLIPIIFALFALSCEPEEIIKYVDKPVYLTQTLTKTDTVETVTEKEVLRIDSVTVIETDTVYVTDTITNLVTDTIVTTKEVIKYDTIVEFVFVTDTVYVERKAEITYLPKYEQYVEYFLSRKSNENMIAIDMRFEDIPPDEANGAAARHNTNLNVVRNGVVVVQITTPCAEAVIYREMMHWLFARPYLTEWQDWDPDATDYIMTKNWGKCLESMSEEERNKYLSQIF